MILVIGSLVLGPMALPHAAEHTATLQGRLLDPSGQPAQGLKVVLQDITTKKEYVSTASDANGEYSLQVPVGAQYLILAALTPEGDRLVVRPSPPMPVRIPGTYRLPDVMFQEKEREGAALPPKAAEPAVVVAEKPFYKTAGGLIGIVFGSIAIVLFAADDDGDRDASPSSP